MSNLKMIQKANENLTLKFGDRHDKPITSKCIEAVYSRNVLSIEADAKTTKGSKNGYLTGILYLAPSKISGINTCPSASKGCAKACLFTAGRGVMYPVFRARVLKTLAFYMDPSRFETTINESIRKLKVKAKNKEMKPIVRLNGTSDILWEKRTNIIQSHPDIQFYDYTKVLSRSKTLLPPNYDLTYSLHESNLEGIKAVLSRGGRVAVVFRDDLPVSFWGVDVVDGDTTDLRFLDAQGVVVGLKSKGPARNDTSGFVQDISTYIETKALETA